MPKFPTYLDAVSWCMRQHVSVACIVKNGKMWVVSEPIVKNPKFGAYPPAISSPYKNEDGPCG